jgi:hypothetical protein
LKLFLIAADGKDKQCGEGETGNDGAQPSHSKDTLKEAKDPIQGMGENFHLMTISPFFFLFNTS